MYSIKFSIKKKEKKKRGSVCGGCFVVWFSVDECYTQANVN